MRVSTKNLLMFSIFIFLAQTSCSKIDPPSHATKSTHEKDSTESESHSVEHEKHEDAHLKPQEKVSEHHSESQKENCNPSEMSSSKEPMKAESHHSAADSGVEAATAFKWLKNGNTRFVTGKVRKDGQSQEDRQRLAAGQKPHTIVLSCSDSRVPPEVLFDQKLGEIFVVRTAGEALDRAAIASIEYAVEHLGSHLLVVMAHESCGAVKAAFSTLDGGDAGSPSLNALVKDIHPRIRKFLGKTPSENFISEAKANAIGVSRDLLARSKIVEEKVSSDQLQIETAVYHLASGWVEFYSAQPSRGLASEKSH